MGDSQLQVVAESFTFYSTLLVLETIDLLLFAANSIFRPFDVGRVVPSPFSAGSPPRFGERPGPWVMCVVAGWLGQAHSPNWLWNWSHYSGIGVGGDWGNAVQPELGEDKDSRSPCPAIK